MNGVGGDIFASEEKMTRGMFVTVLGRYINADTDVDVNLSFSDVDAGAYYVPYAAWSCQKGIIGEDANGHFCQIRASHASRCG